MNRLLCLWLPNWPIQRLVAAQPALRGCGVLLQARDARQGQVVISCSSPAARAGVRAGLPLVEARALVHHAGLSLHVQQYDAAADGERLAGFVSGCERFSPRVAVEPDPRYGGWPAWPESLLMDVTGVGTFFGGERQLACELLRHFHRHGYAARVAIADTLGAAWAAARCLTRSRSRRDAGESAGFERSIAIVSPGDPTELLRSLPIAAFRLSHEVLSLLGQLGITHGDALLKLPRASLRARFGEHLLLRLDQIRGEQEESFEAFQPPPRFEADWSLEYPTASRDTVEWVLGQLVARVSGMLKQHERGAMQLDCRLDCVRDEVSDGTRVLDESAPEWLGSSAVGQELWIRVGLYQPTSSPQHLLQLVRMQAERLMLPGPVARVRVWATRTAPLETRQNELFAAELQRDARPLASLIERLSSRLGRDAVGRPAELPEAQPEHAARVLPLTGSDLQARSARPATAPPPGARPLQLQQPPQPIAVVAVIPDGPPARFDWRGRSHRLVRHWGPERIETAWWRGPSVRRDYYRVETDEGQRFWIFRRLPDGAWFLHGRFE